MLKRDIPSFEKRKCRKKILEAAFSLSEKEPSAESYPYGLESGNKKTGTSGSKYDYIFVWNLPMVITCPGASAWCLENCYNGDDRMDIYPVDKWCENLWWINNKPEELKSRICLQLSDCQKKHKNIAVRLHSSGDFFSVEYIQFWRSIITAYPEVAFWAYTRSWRVSKLMTELQKLSDCPNFNLYYSYDKTMTDAVPKHKKAFVVENEEVLNTCIDNQAVSCPEQHNRVDSCSSCGICIKDRILDIYFVLH